MRWNTYEMRWNSFEIHMKYAGISMKFVGISRKCIGLSHRSHNLLFNGKLINSYTRKPWGYEIYSHRSHNLLIHVNLINSHTRKALQNVLVKLINSHTRNNENPTRNVRGLAIRHSFLTSLALAAIFDSIF